MRRCANESIGAEIGFANGASIVALLGFRAAASEREKESSIFLRATRRSLALRRSGGRAFDQASIAGFALISISQAGDLPVAADLSKCIFVSPRHDPAFPTEEMSGADVAAAAGYSSQRLFAAAFRQHFGFGPAGVPVRGERRWEGR